MPDHKGEIIALLNLSSASFDIVNQCDLGGREIMRFGNGLEMALKYEKQKLNIVGTIAEGEIMGPYGVSLLESLVKRNFPKMPFFIICKKLTENLARICMQTGITDAFTLPIHKEQIENKVNFILEHWSAMQKKAVLGQLKSYKPPLSKRIFDILFAGTALLFLSPFLLLVIIAMKIESRGPVFYYSLRVGSGYHIFKFYKFRSMFVNADKKLKDLKHLNQYASTKSAEEVDVTALCDECRSQGSGCMQPLYADDNWWCEKQYSSYKKQQSGAAFIKIKNDPRVTKVGKFLRNTSIDEIPQLWNVLKGEMSMVGNRPLPLYEAEKLTSDRYAQRFLAPAGITGLWQVEKRGKKGEMSEDERLMLDNTYAQNVSLRNDLRLILKTIPALFQKENV